MYYVYDICPKCMDKLIERKHLKNNELNFKIHGGTCENCGGFLRLILTGEKKLDDIKYKISFECGDSPSKKEVEAIMKIYNCSMAVALEKLNDDNKVLFEGDLLHTYLNMKLLNDNQIVYNVEPKFPFERRIYFDCLDCGSETIDKIVEADDSKEYMKKGAFCENCGKWVTHCYVSKKKWMILYIN